MTLRIRREFPDSNGRPPIDGISPIVWFAELVNALKRGDLPRAVEAQGALDAYGFRVTFHPQPVGRGDAR